MEVTTDYLLCDAVGYNYRVYLEEYADQIDKLSKKDKEKLAKIVWSYVNGIP